MKEYKIYGGLKYLIHDGKTPVFRFICYQEEKTKKYTRKVRGRRRRRTLRRRKIKLTE